jgi:hypothetical protein
MSYEKILILEGSWAEEDEKYISDTRSTARIYRGIEALLSLQEEPINIIQRPLLSFRFVNDIKQFTKLRANSRGVNAIIISGHGRKKYVRKEGGKKIRRKIEAIDGDINLSIEINKVKESLNRSIIILDACNIGGSLESFYNISGALCVIGFSKTVNWIDSSVFIFALLCKFQEDGVFKLERVSLSKPRKIIKEMKDGAYKSLMDYLGVEYFPKIKKIN